MKKLALFAATAAVLAAPSAFAQEGPMMTLAKAKTCMACHAIDKKLVGPSYKDVATHYAKAENKANAGKLAAKIKAGGSGTFGAVPMPANNVTEDEAKKLAAWILAGADPKK